MPAYSGTNIRQRQNASALERTSSQTALRCGTGTRHTYQTGVAAESQYRCRSAGSDAGSTPAFTVLVY